MISASAFPLLHHIVASINLRRKDVDVGEEAGDMDESWRVVMSTVVLTQVSRGASSHPRATLIRFSPMATILCRSVPKYVIRAHHALYHTLILVLLSILYRYPGEYRPLKTRESVNHRFRMGNKNAFFISATKPFVNISVLSSALQAR